MGAASRQYLALAQCQARRVDACAQRRHHKHVGFDVAGYEQAFGANAQPAKALRCLLVLDADPLQRRQGRPHQYVPALVGSRRVCRQSAIGQHHRHALRLGGLQKIRPDFALQQDHDTRTQIPQKAPWRAHRIQREIPVPDARTEVLAQLVGAGGRGTGDGQGAPITAREKGGDERPRGDDFAHGSAVQHHAVTARRIGRHQRQPLAPACAVGRVLAPTPPEVGEEERQGANPQRAVHPCHGVQFFTSASGQPPTALAAPGDTISRCLRRWRPADWACRERR